MQRPFKLKYETLLYILITFLANVLSEHTKITITESFENNKANYFLFNDNNNIIYIAKQAIQSENRQIFSFNPSNNVVENLPSETDPPYLIKKTLRKSNNEYILIYQNSITGNIAIKGNSFNIMTSLESSIGNNIYDIKFIEINNEKGLIIINDTSNTKTVLCYLDTYSQLNHLYTSISNVQCEIAFDNEIICFLTENNRLKYFFISNPNDISSNTFIDTETDIIIETLSFYTEKNDNIIDHIICYVEQNSIFECYTISIDKDLLKVDWENKSKIYSNNIIQPNYFIKAVSLTESIAFLSYLYNNIGFNIVLLNDKIQTNELKYHLFSVDDTYVYLDHIVINGILFILYHDQSVVYIQGFYSFENIYQRNESDIPGTPTFYKPNYTTNGQSVNLISLPSEIQYTFTIDSFDISTVGNYHISYYYENDYYHYYFKNILNIYPINCITTDSTGLICVTCKDGYILSDDGVCIDPDEVPDGYYYDSKKQMVYKCDDNCMRCEMDSSGINRCKFCNENYFLYNDYYCIKNCPTNAYYSYNLKSCFDNCPEDYIVVIYTNNTKVCYSYIEEISTDLPNNEVLLEEFVSHSINEQQQIVLSTVQNIIDNKDNINKFRNGIYLFQEYLEIIKSISNHKQFIVEEKFVNDIEIIIESLITNFNITLNDFYAYETTNLIFFKEFDNFISNTNVILTNNSFTKMQSFFIYLLTLLRTQIVKNNSFISAATQSLNSLIQLSINNNKYYHKTTPDFNITLFNESELYQYEHSLIINSNTTSISQLLNRQLILVSQQMKDQSLFFQSPIYSFGTFKLKANSKNKQTQNNFNIITHKDISLSVVIYNETSSLNSNSVYKIIENNKVSTLIAIPSSFPKKDKITYIGIVQYTNSPHVNSLLVNQNKLSNNVISLLMFNKNNEEIEINDSNEKFYIVFSKSHYKINKCSFMNKTTGKLDNKGCVTEELVKYVFCKCSHLTDFTLTSFDISEFTGENESIFVDKRFINSFKIFIYLNKSNAYMLYFYIVFTILYFGSLIYISCYKKEHENSNFFFLENHYEDSNEKVNIYLKHINNKVNEMYNKLQLNEISNQQNINIKNTKNKTEQYVELKQITNYNDNENDLLSQQSFSFPQFSHYSRLILFKIFFFSFLFNEYRPIAIFSKKQLPTISQYNLTILLFTRIIIQISIASFISEIHITPPYNRFSIETINNVFRIIFLSDFIYSILEFLLSKKQVYKTYNIVEIEFTKLKVVWRIIITYVVIIILSLFNILNTIWINVYTDIYNVKIDFVIDFSICFIVDYLLYEIIIIALKSLMFTEAVRGNRGGCFSRIISRIVFKVEYVFYKYEID